MAEAINRLAHELWIKPLGMYWSEWFLDPFIGWRLKRKHYELGRLLGIWE